MNKELTVINLFAGPCSGKSTNSAGLFYLMKISGMSVELVTEYAKEKVYDEHLQCLEDQLYVFAKQQKRLKRLVGRVKYAITDSPLMLSILYNKNPNSCLLNTLIAETFNSYNNWNYFIGRQNTYSMSGRIHTEEESIMLDKRLLSIIKEYDIPMNFLHSDSNCANNIFRSVEGRL